MTNISSTIMQINTSLNNLGCTQEESNCTLTFITIDSLNNTANNVTYQISADDLAPRLNITYPLDNSRIDATSLAKTLNFISMRYLCFRKSRIII
jgi:hypothetical protein